MRLTESIGGTLAPWKRQAYAEDVVGPEDSPIPVTGKMPRILQMRPTLRFSRDAVPLLLQGTCLAPWLTEGDCVWYDERIEPKDGDIVVFQVFYQRKNDGKQMLLPSVKQLRVLEDGSRYLVCNQGFLDANDLTILGPVTGWHRRKWWRRPPVRKMHFDLPIVTGDYSNRARGREAA